MAPGVGVAVGRVDGNMNTHTHTHTHTHIHAHTGLCIGTHT